MNYQIIFYIIELFMFLLSISLLSLRNSSAMNSRLLKVITLTSVIITLIGGAFLSIYDVVLFFNEESGAFLKFSIFSTAVLTLFILFRKQYLRLSGTAKRIILIILIVLSWLCFI